MAGKLLKGKKLYESKLYDQALAELLAVDGPANDPELCYYLGLCYTQMERYDEGMIYLEQVVTSSSNLLHVYQSRMILGYTYTITRRYRLALFEFDKLVEAGYESAQIFAALGFIAYKQNKPEESLEYFEKAVKMDPENPNALNSMGFTLAETGVKSEDALSMCKKAVDIKPNNPAYLDSLGWAYYKNGRHLEARTYLRRALEMARSNTMSKEIAAHLKTVMDTGKSA